VPSSSRPRSGIRRRPSFAERYLDPADRLGEILFGLIMTLTFTLGAGLIVQEGRDATTEMLLGIIGCNVAWGLIDGGMYLMTCMFERSRKARLLRSVREARNREEAVSVIGQELDASLEPLTSPQERQHLYGLILERLRAASPQRVRLDKEDLYGAIASFWLVFVSTIPAVLPFLIFRDRFVALRVSNLLLISLLAWVGVRWARVVHGNPWWFGSALVASGLAMVGIAIALGG